MSHSGRPNWERIFQNRPDLDPPGYREAVAHMQGKALHPGDPPPPPPPPKPKRKRR